MPPKSLELEPDSYRFFKSQFAKPVWPPKETSLAGGTGIITGANVGLGFAAAETVLALDLSHLVIAVRTVSKGEAAASKLRRKFPKARIDVWQVDMLSHESVQTFAKKCETLDRIDFAILNAGTQNMAFTRSPEGHESTFQVNYLSTVLLATLLLPTLKKKAPAGKPGRLTIVNSGTSLMVKSKFSPASTYWYSKALAHFWILKLAERVKPEDVIVNLVDPGLVRSTDLQRNANFIVRSIAWFAKWIIARSLEQGASTFVDAAIVKGKETHGSYVMDWKIFHYTQAMYEPYGQELAGRIWDETVEMLSFVDVNGILNSLSVEK
ncbi:hypothetical protein CEP52_017304 [Fusarium oligoseptatum]|uniref:Short-chain dehydrogenase/reductase family protein n=1 Tax=Fusarium oligoseptatum TaxID=2604345 RepID=A0A428RTQ9_9HYPO|nr:hypothetical protein CEP52_017304 [Fusarium oligoseptatum]